MVEKVDVDRDSTLQAIVKRDELVIKKIYQQAFPMVKKMVLKGQGQESDAWDVFQESMIVLFRKAKDPDFTLSSKVSTFIVGVARLIWMKKRGKNQSVVLTNDIPQEYIEDDSILLQAKRERLFSEKLSELGDQCRTILTLFFKKVKMREIAIRLNLASAEVARTTKFRCTKKLMKLIHSDRSFEQLKA